MAESAHISEAQSPGCFSLADFRAYCLQAEGRVGTRQARMLSNTEEEKAADGSQGSAATEKVFGRNYGNELSQMRYEGWLPLPD